MGLSLCTHPAFSFFPFLPPPFTNPLWLWGAPLPVLMKSPYFHLVLVCYQQPPGLWALGWDGNLDKNLSWIILSASWPHTAWQGCAEEAQLGLQTDRQTLEGEMDSNCCPVSCPLVVNHSQLGNSGPSCQLDGAAKQRMVERHWGLWWVSVEEL